MSWVVVTRWLRDNGQFRTHAYGPYSKNEAHREARKMRRAHPGVAVSVHKMLRGDDDGDDG